MKLIDAIGLLECWRSKGALFFTFQDLAKLFNESGNTLRATVRRLETAGALQRFARNMYRCSFGTHADEGMVLEYAAIKMRSGYFTFESLESAASKWGIISQVPVDRLTVMTEGREGVFVTLFGTIEFVHTEASPEEIADNIVHRPDNPLPIATKRYTARNLLACHRSTNLIDWGELDNG